MSITLANKEVNVLQAVSLTLGTSVFVALADALQKMVDRTAPISWGRTLYVAVLIFWGVKLLVENHRSFRAEQVDLHPRYSIFQLVMTIAMFVPLIVSAKSADMMSQSAWLLALSMGAGVIWLVGLGVYYATTPEGFKFDKYPWLWLASALLNFAGAVVIAGCDSGSNSCYSVAILAGMLGIGILDAVITKSFTLTGNA